MNNRKLFLIGFCITLIGAGIFGVGNFVLGGQLAQLKSPWFNNLFIFQTTSNSAPTAISSTEAVQEQKTPTTAVVSTVIYDTTTHTEEILHTETFTYDTTVPEDVPAVIETSALDEASTADEWRQDGFYCTISEQIHKMEIDMATGSLIIKEGNIFSVTGENMDMENFSMYPDLVSGVLIINAGSTNNQMGTAALAEKSTLTITVPVNSYFDYVYVNNTHGSIDVAGLIGNDITFLSGNGPVTVTKLQANDSTFSLGSGSLQMDTIESGKLNAHCEFGNMTVTNTTLLEGLQLSCKIGDIFFTGEVHGDIKITNDSGNIRINLANDPTDFTYSLNVADATINSKKTSSFAHISNVGRYTLRLNVVYGSAKITI